MSTRHEPIDRTLRWYAAFVVRHLVFLACTTSLGLGTGVGLLAATKPVYDSTATIVIEPLPALIDRPSRTLSIDSDAQLLTSTRVIHAAAESVEYPGGAASLERQVRVSAVPAANVLRVTVRDTNPTRARAATQAVASNFLLAREYAAASRAESNRIALEAQLADVTNRLTVHQTLATTPTDYLSADIGLQHALIVEQGRLQRQLVAKAADHPITGFVADPPLAPSVGHRPATPAVLISGALLGLLGGVTAAWLRDGALALQFRRRLLPEPGKA